MTKLTFEQDIEKGLDYLAGVLDGADTSFEMEPNEDGIKVLKSITIKCNVSALHSVEKILVGGSVEVPLDGSLPTLLISDENDMKTVVTLLNGRIRLHMDFREACECVGIEHERPAYSTSKNLEFKAGVIDGFASVTQNTRAALYLLYKE